MTLTEFITKYNNKYVEVVDPNAYAQCFDLVLQWCVDQGIPKNIFPFYNAYQIYTNFGTAQAKYFDRIVNTPDAVPKAGDILVWGNSYNYAGMGHGSTNASGAGSPTTNGKCVVFGSTAPTIYIFFDATIAAKACYASGFFEFAS